jgi:hypothetical protein
MGLGVGRHERFFLPVYLEMTTGFRNGIIARSLAPTTSIF